MEPTAHPKVLRSPADPVSEATTDLIETLIQSALSEPDNWVALRVQLRALVPDFHVPPPPPPTEDSEHRAAAISGERKLKLAWGGRGAPLRVSALAKFSGPSSALRAPSVGPPVFARADTRSVALACGLSLLPATK